MILDKNNDSNRLLFNSSYQIIEGNVILILTKTSSSKKNEFEITPTKITDRYVEINDIELKELESGQYKYQLNTVIGEKIDAGYLRIIKDEEEDVIEHQKVVKKVINGRKR